MPPVVSPATCYLKRPCKYLRGIRVLQFSPRGIQYYRSKVRKIYDVGIAPSMFGILKMGGVFRNSLFNALVRVGKYPYTYRPYKNAYLGYGHIMWGRFYYCLLKEGPLNMHFQMRGIIYKAYK